MKKGIFIFVVCFISLLTCFTAYAYARPDELEIGCGTTTITLEGDREIQKNFMILKDGALIFNVKPMVESCNIVFRKYDEEDKCYRPVKTIRFEESNNVISKLVNLDKGIYLVTFYTEGIGSIEYSVDLTEERVTNNEDNLTKESATDVTYGEEITDYVPSMDGDFEKYYKVILEKDGLLTFDISGAKGMGYTIYNEYGVDICSNSLEDKGICTITHYLDKGTYYLALSDFKFTGIIKLKATYKKSNVSIETNNYIMDDAYEINYDVKFSGLMTENHEAEYFKINVEKDEEIAVALKTSYKDARITVINKDGMNVDVTKCDVSDNTELFIVKFKASVGQYIIKLDSNNEFLGERFTGDYELMIGTNADELENTILDRPGVVNKIKILAKNASAIKIGWNKVTDATGYRVFKYENKKWVKQGDTKGNNFIVKNLKSGTAFKIAVIPYKNNDGKVVWAKNYTAIYGSTKPGVVGKFKASKASKTAIKTTWSKTTGATGYSVYIYKNKKWVRLANVKNNTYTFKNLKRNTTYKFAVRAYKTYGGTTDTATKYTYLTAKTAK